MSADEGTEKTSDHSKAGEITTETSVEGLTKTVVPEKADEWKRFSALVSVERGFSAMESLANYTGVTLIIVLMLFVSFGVASRYIFNRPFAGHVDIPEMIGAILAFLALAYTQRKDGHIRMEVFVTSVLKGQSRYLVEFINRFLSVAIIGLMTFYGFRNALDAFTIGDVTPSIYWPTWPAKLIVATGGLLLLGRLSIEMLQHLARATGMTRR